MDRHNYSDIKEFYNAIENAQAEVVILCYTDEWGPKNLDDNAVYCGPLQEASLLSYKDGTIYNCDLSNEAADRDLLKKDIEAHGFRWEERERNSGKYGT